MDSYEYYYLMQKYIPLEGRRSNVVQTAWAMMGLIHAGQVILIKILMLLFKILCLY